MWRRVREPNPGHSGGGQVLSLHHPQEWRKFLQLRVQNEFTNSIQKVKSTGGMCFYGKRYFIINIKFQRWCLFKFWELNRPFPSSLVSLFKSKCETFHVKMSSASMCYCLRPITKRINLSLDSGCFLRTWKCAVVQSLLKNDGLPPVFKNFRPVSNLTFISKLVDTVVAKQLQHYFATICSQWQVPISLSTEPQHRI